MTIYLDKELTKQELQMENRRLRNFIKQLIDNLTTADLEHWDGHKVCDFHLALINRFIETESK